jgi:hypothetical protein
MTEAKRYSLVKPTNQTPFHIDFDWWSQNERNWHVHLLSYLSEEHRNTFGGSTGDEMIDLVDPHTAEVKQVDALQYLLITHYVNKESFLTESTSLVEAIFRLFLANGNQPMSPAEIGERLKRPPELILRTLTGARVYRGLRPYGAHHHGSSTPTAG